MNGALSDKAGWAVLVLALGIMASIIIISVGSEITNQPLSSEEQTLLSTIIGAAIGAVATYVGGGRAGTGHAEESEDTSPNRPGPHPSP